MAVKKPKKRGPKPKPRNQVRTQRLVVFLTKGELRELKQVAKRERVSLSRLVHALVLRRLQQERGD